MFRRSFLGGLTTSVVALLLPRHVQAAPRDQLPKLEGIHEAPERKIYFSVQLQKDGSLVWKRCHF